MVEIAPPVAVEQSGAEPSERQQIDTFFVGQSTDHVGESLNFSTLSRPMIKAVAAAAISSGTPGAPR
jgi:hypothetical protein